MHIVSMHSCSFIKKNDKTTTPELKKNKFPLHCFIFISFINIFDELIAKNESCAEQLTNELF